MYAPRVRISRRSNLPILLCLVALFLLLANGRMDSGDANAQLQGALSLARTGSLGSDQHIVDPTTRGLFVQSPNGRYYEAHDIGNSLLMLPAAEIAVTAARHVPKLQLQGAAGTYSDSAMILAKVLCSLTDTLFSAIACYFLFLLFNLFLTQRASGALALLFVFGTYFAGYFRSAWDVLPACDACCIFLYFLLKTGSDEEPHASAPLLAAFWCGIACSFRYSLFPFLGLSLVLVFFLFRKHNRVSVYLYSLVVFALMLLPTMLFNLVRMGSLLKPATMSAQFADQNGLTGNIIPGAFGLLASPNRGLFVFSPILLLVFALPWCWKALPLPVRSLLTGLAPGAIFYYLLIARLRNWGAAGWGPRYLLPVMPIIFVASGFVLASLWQRGRIPRILAIVLIAVSCACAIPAIVVDYTDAIRPDAAAADPNSRSPRQIIDTYTSLASSLRGRPGVTANANDQGAPTVFPDLAASRVATALKNKSHVAEVGFILIYIALMASVFLLLALRLRDKRSPLPLARPV